MRTRDPYMHRPSNSRHETVMTRSRRHLAIATARLRQKPPRCVSFALAWRTPREERCPDADDRHRPPRESRSCRRDVGRDAPDAHSGPHTGTSPFGGGCCQSTTPVIPSGASPPSSGFESRRRRRRSVRGRCRADKRNTIRGRSRTPKSDVEFCEMPILQANFDEFRP